MTSSYLLLIIFTIMGAIGSFFFKKASESNRSFPIQFFYYLKGGLCYGGSAILNIIVLQDLPYTVVLPCSSITYIWSYYLGSRYLLEQKSRLKIGGIILIILGSILIVSHQT